MSITARYGFYKQTSRSLFSRPPLPEAVVGPAAFTSPTVNGTTVRGVANDTELRSLLSGAPGIVTDVVLTGSTYTNAGPLRIRTLGGGAGWLSVRYWSESLFSAECDYGWIWDGTGAQENPYVRGISWVIDDVNKLGGPAIYVAWFFGSAAQGARMYDCQIEGDGIALQGIAFTATSGVNAANESDVRRCIVNDCQNFGLHLNAANPISTATIVEDIQINRIYRLGDARGESLGTAEVGLYLGQPADINRVSVIDTGNATIGVVGGAIGGTINNATVDYGGASARMLIYRNPATAGVYFEEGEGWTVDTLYVGEHIGAGANVEWDMGGPARNEDHSVTNMTSLAFRWGGFCDDGSLNTSFSRCRIERANLAGIGRHPDATITPFPPSPALMRYDLGEFVEFGDTYVGTTSWSNALGSGAPMHPEQFYGAIDGEDYVGAVFHGDGDDYIDVAVNQISGGIGNMSTGGNHAWITNDAIIADQAKTYIMSFSMSTASTGWLFRILLGSTVLGVNPFPIAGPWTDLRFWHNGVALDDWSPPGGNYDPFPVTGTPDDMLMAVVIDSDLRSVRLHLANLSTQVAGVHHITLPSDPTATTGQSFILGGEVASASATNAWSDDIYWCGIFDGALDPGVIARMSDSTPNSKLRWP